MSGRLPVWFRKKLPPPGVVSGLESMFSELRLHTVCQSALCPNLGDCFQHHTATFMLLGNTCTRNCTFCAVRKGQPQPLDPEEPRHIAEAVVRMGLKYVVLTSVTRDDLCDGGACQFAKTVALLRTDPSIAIEVLIPDFGGDDEALETVVDAHPHVINHNIETVPRLYHEVRPKADFQRSLRLLRRVKQLDPTIVTKSGLMVGLGETREELTEAMLSLRSVGCDLLTIGQYLQPSATHHAVVRYVPPEEFDEYGRMANDMGFASVASAPLVRSSFNAAESYQKMTHG